MAAVELFNTTLFTDANLQAYYRLESGALTTDSKNSNTLTNHGVVTSVAGLFGNGASITSNSQWLSVGNAFGITNALTMMGWWKMNTAPTSQQYNIWYTGSNGTNVAYWIDYEYNAGSPRINFARFKSGVGNQYTYYSFTNDTSLFHHYALTYDGTNVRGYLDGVKVVTSSSYTGNGSGGLTGGTQIAQDIINGDLNNNHGIYDDMAYFDRVLSDKEISDYYNGPLGGSFLLNFI